MKRGFYQSYEQENEQRQKRIIVKNGGIGMAVTEVLKTILIAIFYVSMTVFSSIGLTTVLNKPLRDMLIELVMSLIFGK